MIDTALHSARKSSLRILVVTPFGKGGRGGIDRIMDEIRTRLAILPPSDLTVSFWMTRGQSHILLSMPLVIMVVLRLAGSIFGFGPDLVHINLAQYGSTFRKAIIARAARLFGIPYVIHLHGSRFRQSWERASPFASAHMRNMFLCSAHILVLGNIWLKFVLSKAPEVQDRIEILPNASPSSDISIDEKEKDCVSILFLGLLSERKGAPQLIAALSALPSDSNWRATIAGNGQVDAAREEVRRLGLSHKVDLPGWVGPDAVTMLLRQAHILVLPSFDENLPLSVIEGMAHGLAIVTTPVGAVEDIITNEETGLLVPPGDSESLAEALKRLIVDPLLRENLGRAAQTFHRQHLEIGRYYDQLLRVWRKAA